MIFLYFKKKSGKGMPLRNGVGALSFRRWGPVIPALGPCHSGVGRNLCQGPEILTYVRMTDPGQDDRPWSGWHRPNH